MLRQLDFHGNSSIGVFCVCSDAVAFVPEQADDEFIREMKDALEVDVERLSIDGSPLLGSLIAMNSKGAVVADFALSEDLKRISSWVEVGTVEDNLNAIGNNLIANDNGILAHPDLEEDTLELISSILRVPVVKGTMGGMGTIGANAVVNRKGLLCHPKSTEEERKIAEKILKVPSGLGTANFGSPLVGAALISNSYGGVAGTKTTGVELHRIEDALVLY